MTTASKASSFRPAADRPLSSQFERLDPAIQRWIYQQGWTGLRDAQEEAIPLLLKGGTDLIIAAPTAAGKTEAAFLPILTRMLAERGRNGSLPLAIYISPLKALINDQTSRLEQLCERLEIPLTAWHGDISASRKQRFLKDPSGVLLITPESLEAMFVTKGSETRRMAHNLAYIAVDELHAFIGSERGKQFQSLMHRLESLKGAPVPRIGLSATLGNMQLASSFLRPSANGDAARRVRLIQSRAPGPILKIQLRGYGHKNPDPAQNGKMSDRNESERPEDLIAEHLYKVMRGSNNLIFPNTRGLVELYADRLRRKSRLMGAPNEFYPHHGSLSKAVREDTEQNLKKASRASTAIATSTLELGIDVGQIRAVAQIGPPPSVSALRQRLGRSGRREGEPAILRAYCIESELDGKSPLSDQLREGLAQTIAMIRLLVQGWCEPPAIGGLHLSTLVQQILSLLAEKGGSTAMDLWQILCAPQTMENGESGPFSAVSQADFSAVLKGMGAKELLMQERSGLLLPAPKGEQRINHYDFYSAFMTEPEYKVAANGRILGQLPVSRPLEAGQHLILAGQRWIILDVDLPRRTVNVRHSPGGRVPQFSGLGPQIHASVRQEMKKLLSEETPCPFLDAEAQRLLAEARKNFRDMELDKKSFLEASASRTLLLPWDGDPAHNALALLLHLHGLPTDNNGLVIEVAGEPGAVRETLREIGSSPLPPLEEMAEFARIFPQEKWDWVLPKTLALKSYASSNLDFDTARQKAAKLATA